MKILISAAETSSDLHGAQLLNALRRECAKNGESVEAFGIGGPKLQAAGLRTVVDARALLSMGFTEILGRLPQIFRALRTVTETASREKPDVALVIDYPDFHFRLAKRLKRAGIPVIYFIPPKVWAWRKKRIRVLRERFVRILSILPFETDFYRKENVPVRYVGNPLVDELPLKMTRAEARKALNLAEDDPVLLVMPGSRPSELKYHLELMLEAGALAGREIRPRTGKVPIVLIPVPGTSDIAEIRRKIDDWKSREGSLSAEVDFRLSQGDAHECMLAADASLIKSGTSTLEAGILGCVHSIMYRSNLLTHFIFRAIIRYKGPVGLVNLVAGWEPGKPWLIRELINYRQTSRELADELLSLYGDSERRCRLQEGLSRVRERILAGTEGRGPSDVAAREIVAWVRKCPSS